MRSACLWFIILLLGLTGCVVPPEYQYASQTQVSQTVQAAVATAQATMRVPTATTTWTPIYVPTATSTATATLRPSATLTSTIAPAPTATWTLTPRVPTPTSTTTPTNAPQPPGLTTTILGCDTGLDIAHGLGEVMNAYVRVRNTSGGDLTNVCVILNATNEGKPHPDKSRCFNTLKLNYEVTTKLTVDTQSGTPTTLSVTTTNTQGLNSTVSGAGCRALDSAGLNQVNAILNIPRQVQ